MSSEGGQSENLTPGGMDIHAEHLSVKLRLNDFVSNVFPENLKNQLYTIVRDVKTAVGEVLTQPSNDAGQNRTKAQVISDILADFFQTLRNRFSFRDEELEQGNVFAQNEESTDFLVMIEEYFSTFYYQEFFGILEMTSQLVDFEDTVSKLSWISPNHLEINLKEENDRVRVCMYQAIRNLCKMSTTIPAHGKLECIFEASKLMQEALYESSGKTRPVSADDLLPAMIYIIMKAKVPKILCHVDFISNFIGDRTVLGFGERGYYFTTFQCAMNVIIKGLEIPIPENSPFEENDFFTMSVDIIHREVRKVSDGRKAELVQLVKTMKKNLQQGSNKRKLTSDEKEQKVWNVIKWIPAVNIGYGLIRSPVYAAKGNKEEAVKSLIGAAGGAVGIGAGVAGFMVSGPLIVPIMASMVAGGAANQTVTGGGELLVDTYVDPESFTSLSNDDREKRVYEKVIKDIPLIGLGYSAVRAPVYLGKGKKAEAKRSIINAAVNGGASGIGIAAGVGMSKLVSRLPANASSAVVDAADDVAKPVATEIIDFITESAIRTVSAPSVNAAVRIGACNMSRMAVERGVCAMGGEGRNEYNQIF